MKKIFYFSLGVAIGVVMVSKARAYVKNRLPQGASSFLFSDEENLPATTLQALLQEFSMTMEEKEKQLVDKFLNK
ncbi:MAG: hypothetical protein J6P10_00695 [Aeriscardovia sp.]|nr:hypothetical protein [Aeriscardovia sp.]